MKNKIQKAEIDDYILLYLSELTECVFIIIDDIKLEKKILKSSPDNTKNIISIINCNSIENIKEQDLKKIVCNILLKHYNPIDEKKLHDMNFNELKHLNKFIIDDNEHICKKKNDIIEKILKFIKN